MPLAVTALLLGHPATAQELDQLLMQLGSRQSSHAEPGRLNRRCVVMQSSMSRYVCLLLAHAAAGPSTEQHAAAHGGHARVPFVHDNTVASEEHHPNKQLWWQHQQGVNGSSSSSGSGSGSSSSSGRGGSSRAAALAVTEYMPSHEQMTASCAQQLSQTCPRPRYAYPRGHVHPLCDPQASWAHAFAALRTALLQAQQQLQDLPSGVARFEVPMPRGCAALRWLKGQQETVAQYHQVCVLYLCISKSSVVAAGWLPSMHGLPAVAMRSHTYALAATLRI